MCYNEIPQNLRIYCFGMFTVRVVGKYRRLKGARESAMGLKGEQIICSWGH